MPSPPRGCAEPVGQHLTPDRQPLPRQHLCLTIQGQVVGVAGDQHLGDGRLGRQAAGHQALRRRRLQHHARAGAAGELRAPVHQYAELGGDDTEPLGAVGADLDQRAIAAGAGVALGPQHLFDARQMGGQMAAIGPAALRLLLALLRRAPGRLGRALGQRRLDLLEGEQQLLLGQPLRLPPELTAPELEQQVVQRLVARHSRIALLHRGVALGHHGQQQRPQRRGILRQARCWRGGGHRAVESRQRPSAWESALSPAPASSRCRRTAQRTRVASAAPRHRPSAASGTRLPPTAC